MKATPASTTDRIDLITQPGVRYDAGGGSGLINIRTKKIKLRGVNLSLDGNYSQWKFGERFGSALLNLREDRFNLYSAYSYCKGKDMNDLQIDRVWTGKEDRMNQISHREFNYTSHDCQVGFDYYVTKRITLGVSISGNVSNHVSTGEMKTRFLEAGALDCFHYKYTEKQLMYSFLPDT